MKKFTKIIMITLILAIVVAPMTTTFIQAAPAGTTGGVPGSFPSAPAASGNEGIMGLVNTGWGLVLTICQIAAFAIIIFCGLKYMFSSASEKADLKKSMVPLLIGAILVFGSTFIVNIVMAIVSSLNT